MPNVSVGQAAANALHVWLASQLSSDITVYPRWPEPSNLPPKVVSILRVGRRTRIDASGLWIANRTNLTPTLAHVGLMIGAFEQALQLDIWATTDVARDDILAQLDRVLYAGIPQTLGLHGDPFRDGVLLPLGDGFYGNADFFFDDTSIDDTPEAIQRLEFRAMIDGMVRMAFVLQADVPRLLDPKVDLTLVDAIVPPVVP